MTIGAIETIARNGQVTLPAEVRSRWNVRRVVVADLGDRVVVRPLRNDPILDPAGKYRGRGPSTDQARQDDRLAERTREDRRRNVADAASDSA
jgi:AbrB family looped-hinge helix DNA binding protein